MVDFLGISLISKAENVRSGFGEEESIRFLREDEGPGGEGGGDGADEYDLDFID